MHPLHRGTAPPSPGPHPPVYSAAAGDVYWTMATLAPEDMLLVICAHGSHHHWSRLQWICDVARLVRVHPTLDWGRVMEQARTSDRLNCIMSIAAVRL